VYADDIKTLRENLDIGKENRKILLELAGTLVWKTKYMVKFHYQNLR